MAKYSQIFSLKDIFNNKNLAGKLPLVNYKEKDLDNGRTQVRTSPKTINTLVYDISVRAARPFYKPFTPKRSGDTIILSGELTEEQDLVVESVYNALQSQKTIMVWTVNNTDMIRDALKEAENSRRKFGINSKLYLRAASMQQIEGMTRPQIQALLTNIMENIYFSDNFPATQKKYGVEKMSFKQFSYKQMKENWKKRVGDL